MNLYLVEYYTKDVVSGGIGGWDIRFAWVYAENSPEARAKMSVAPNFDEIILVSQQAEKFELFLGHPVVTIT